MKDAECHQDQISLKKAKQIIKGKEKGVKSIIRWVRQPAGQKETLIHVFPSNKDSYIHHPNLQSSNFNHTHQIHENSLLYQ